MREWMVWQDPPVYYDPPGGLLAIDLEPPEELLRPSGREPRSVEAHFELVNWQLARIRSGLVLAELTGRVLIMPKLWCGYDRWWAPHHGRIPGSSMPLPIRCPLDHVFNLEGSGLKPEMLREYSFLDNPLTPPAVKHSQHNLTLPAPMSREAVEGALKAEAARTAKVLRIVQITDDVYQKALTQDEQASFQKRSMNYLGIWCCIQPLTRGKPGHIWYDMMWDIIPHTDRWKQEWTTAWHPAPSK